MPLTTETNQYYFDIQDGSHTNMDDLADTDKFFLPKGKTEASASNSSTVSP